uniref:Unconventional myosin-IXb-like n=1 Tax=Scleropages formosus TaxID=113540 RepID=A0A8C9TC50_SCLFO
MSGSDSDGRSYVLQVYQTLMSQETGRWCTIVVPRETTAAAVIKEAVAVLGADPSRHYVLAEVKECGGEEWVLQPCEQPVLRILLWPLGAQEQHPCSDGYYFLLRECDPDGAVCYRPTSQPCGEKVAAQKLVERGFLPPEREDVDDLCDLPVLTESSILGVLRTRFQRHKIYTYAGSMLVAVNPFTFLPIYNPKYVKMYEKRALGELGPHVFAIADVAYHTMLQRRRNQCVLISGESGSGKTQSTNFLIHCLTALSQKGYTSGIERTILGAGPVLEAFGNAKTAYNNNSSRFGKFIQVNYLESGIVRGAVVEKYLLEKSRLISREKNERNYHVFYYLLVGASEDERKEFKLLRPEEYLYLKQENLDMEDKAVLRHEFERLQQAMGMVGFLPPTKKQIFAMLAAILYLGNVTYKPRGTDRDEGLEVGPPGVLAILSDLLQVRKELLVEALTQRTAVTANDTLIFPYSPSEAVTVRDSMAKSLYSALFDWIVLRINHALLNKKDMEECISFLSIGVLDIFGFEDFKTNSFEQFCINYANEQLQFYFNQHIFKLEQEGYQAEGISWHNIDYMDNVGCIHLFSKKPTGLFYLLDEESNFPHATDKTLLAKLKQQHQGNPYFVPTPVLEPAFVVRHFAGNVKYHVKDFREKNTDHMRADIVTLLRCSDRAYVRQLVGMAPAAAFRWGVLRATVCSLAVLKEAGRQHAEKTTGCRRTNACRLTGVSSAVTGPFLHSYGSCIDFSFDRSMERPLEAFEDIFASYESKKRNRHFGVSMNLIDASSLKLIMGLSVHDRTTRALLHLHKGKKPPSISAQFQASLSKLLETLGRAEPFFIRCIRSNADKMEMCFDDSLVLQQLRYTGMLETVRIRRSGYSAKYTFEEFVEQFRVLLPTDASTPQRDIANFFQKMGLAAGTYQIGKTKVFLKEPERQRLQDMRHKRVMDKILYLQRWFRAHLDRKQFLLMRSAAIVIQRHWRRMQEERRYRVTAIIQAMWENSYQRAEYLHQRNHFKNMQKASRPCPSGRGRAIIVRPLHPKRRLAHGRSGLMLKGEDVEYKEFWTFPLPPMSPGPPPPPLPLPDVNSPACPPQPKVPGMRWSPWLLHACRAGDQCEIQEAEHTRDPLLRCNTALDVTMSMAREDIGSKPKRLSFQVNDLHSKGKHLSAVENIFIRATVEFRENIKSLYALSNLSSRCCYKDLMMNYQDKVCSLAGQKQKTEVPLVVNLFQSILDGFVRAEIKKEEVEPEKVHSLTEHRLDHVLSTYQVNIMQSCDQCTSYIWGMEKAYMCSSCKMVCHKKCLSKINKCCSPYCSKKQGSSQLFGIPVCVLTSEDSTVPVVMAMLLEHVELKGLYTEGIYRKSGAAHRVKELHQRLEKDLRSVCLEEYPIHTVTGLIKQWLRELPEPLMTYTHYSDFLHAIELPEKSEQLKAIYTVLERLPTPSFNTLERLIFHLVRVAKEEAHNRMSPSSLAIIFAPCILRTPDTSDPLTSLKDMGKTTMCLEILLNEQMRLYREKLNELQQLEYAEALVVKQLKLKRQNTTTFSEDESMDTDSEVEEILVHRQAPLARVQ